MTWILTIVGLILGIFVADGGREMLGLALGATCGFLLGRVIHLDRRVAALELSESGGEAVDRTETSHHPDFVAPQETPERAPTQSAEEPDEIDPELEPQPIAASAADDDPWLYDARVGSDPGQPREPNVLERAFDGARRWITSGNIPVKVGVIISFFGVAFLLKYAVDRELLVVPIELRLLGVAAGAIAALFVGWRRRERMPAYGLSLQGGAIGVLYLTIFAAMRLYSLIPQTLAFALLVALTAGIGFLAVLQNARALAILGVVGGFLAPVLVSTGGGSHVALFSYYLLLNAAILGIAWFRSWRLLNVIGFAFTFGIGALWGIDRYQPSMMATTMPFLIAHFLFYQAVAVLYALRQPPDLRGLVDGSLVFGTPVIAFTLQAGITRHTEYGLAISAVAAGLFYAVTATLLHATRGRELRLLVESFIALAVAFGTLAIPLAFDAQWTTAAWALEGAALVWIGRRQDHLLATVVGVVLVFVGGLIFLDRGWNPSGGLAVLNGNVMAGALVAIGALFSSRLLSLHTQRYVTQHRAAGIALLVWGMAWWVGTGAAEVSHRADDDYGGTALVLFLAASFGLLLLIARRLDWTEARYGGYGLLPLLALPLPAFLFHGNHPFAHFGWAAWPLAAAVQYATLYSNEGRFPRSNGVAHVAKLVSVTALLIWEAGWRMYELELSSSWIGSAMTMVPALIALAVIAWPAAWRWPVHARPRAYSAASGIVSAIALGLTGLLTFEASGDASPLPYVPILNPVDIATGLSIVAAWAWLARARTGWLQGARWPWALGAVGAAAFVGSTAMLLRAVHHFGAVPWNPSALFESVMVQAAVSIYWGLLAGACMLLGTRRGQRALWMLGAALMAVVVVKLFVVDLANSATVARIVSFLGVGGLLVIIGYFSPAPPRPGKMKSEPVMEPS